MNRKLILLAAFCALPFSAWAQPVTGTGPDEIVAEYFESTQELRFIVEQSELSPLVQEAIWNILEHKSEGYLIRMSEPLPGALYTGNTSWPSSEDLQEVLVQNMLERLESMLVVNKDGVIVAGPASTYEQEMELLIQIHGNSPAAPDSWWIYLRP